MSGIEGIGEMVSGGLAARAVEPGAGEAQHDEGGGACLNCGAELTGPYCNQCGQAGHVHRTLGAFWHDLAHGVLHFEGKIWRTLPLLAWRPGELTRRYIAGERARFVSPIAIFLFSVFMMFAVFSFLGGPFDIGDTNFVEMTPAQVRAQAEHDFQAAQTENRGELAEWQQTRLERIREGKDTASADRHIRQLQADMQLQERMFRRTMNLTGGGTTAGGHVVVTAPAAAEEHVSDIELIDAAWRHAKDNPQLLVYKLQTNAYKFSWALIPISVPFLWLLFLHRRRYWRYKAYDHTVFVTYSLAFMSLGLVALSLLRMIGLGQSLIWLAVIFVPPVHIYRQLRGAYELSRFSALWRTGAVLVFALIASILFFLLIFALGGLH
jgi:hypothetical protein